MARPTSPLDIPDIDPAHCSPEMQREMLRRTPFFAALSDGEIAEVHRLATVRGAVSGEALYEEGEPAARLFVVAAGSVRLFQLALSGQETTLDIHVPGEFFGTLALLGEEQYAETAQALTPACLLAFPADAFQQILQRYPPVALAALEVVAARLRGAQQSIHALSAQPVEARVAAILLRLGEKVGEARDGELLLQLPLSRQEIAALSGTTPESASRVMSRFKKAGFVRSGRQWVALRDREALAAIARGEG